MFLGSQGRSFPLTSGGGNWGATGRTRMGVAPQVPLTDSIARNAKPATKTVRTFDRDSLYLEVSPRGGKWWRSRDLLHVTAALVYCYM
jgi:hypothetical protein